LGELTSQSLSSFGIEDEEGNPLDINETIGSLTESFFTSLLGQEVYTGIKDTWHKASRILSSASNIIWTIRSITDSMREIAEWTAENTGKIGNALKRFRVVGENAYKWMPEQVTATNAWMLRINRFREGVDSIDDTASSLSSVLSEVQGIQEEFDQLDEQKNKFNENLQALTPKEREDNTPVKEARADSLEASKAPTGIEDVFRGEGEELQ
jgi:methyl-accepting chemotaxis protein